MQDQTTRGILKTEGLTLKSVSIFINSSYTLLKGNWHWDLHTDSIFCSDVLFSIPESFAGTKGILHPDDKMMVEQKLMRNSETIRHLEFRIITTYGEVKSIEGENIRVEQIEPGVEHFQVGMLQQVGDELQRKKEFETLQLVKEVYEKSERYTGTGIWWYNAETNETWYSNQVFRIYDLPPQSLNAHLNTFSAFVHPDDKEFVTEFTDKAYRKRFPLHIEYRINTASGVKFILHTSNWSYTSKGDEILSGTLQDVTEQKQFDQKMESLHSNYEFYKQQLLLDEHTANMGHWQVNLVTRKTIYSDQVCRIYGLKNHSIPAGINSFINYIHPDDREAVISANKKMLYEHLAPDLDYRIMRSDGKLRYVSQKGKLVSYGGELVMAGSLQDVTVEKMLEKKVRELNETGSVKDFAHQQAEEIAGIGSWIWNIKTGKISWSESFFKILGLKSNGLDLSQQALLMFIHPDDQKKFSDEMSMVLHHRKDAAFEFRFVFRGEVKNMKASFRLMTNEDTEIFIGTVRDITTEHILQQELHQRVQLAEALSENILDRVIITDASNTIIVWNRQCEEVYSIVKEEAIGKNFFDVFPHLKTEEEVQLFNKVLKGEMIFQQGNRSAFVGGHYNLHMLPLWSEERTEVTGILHIIHDVTKETELRQNLNDRLSFIENLVESSVDKIIAMDRNLNYLVWNKKCEEYYGLKKEEVLGRNVLEIFPDTQKTPAYEKFRRVLKGETIYIPPNKDAGSENNFEVYLIPVKNQQEEIIAILWILHDRA